MGLFLVRVVQKDSKDKDINFDSFSFGTILITLATKKTLCEPGLVNRLTVSFVLKIFLCQNFLGPNARVHSFLLRPEYVRHGVAGELWRAGVNHFFLAQWRSEPLTSWKVFHNMACRFDHQLGLGLGKHFLVHLP